MAKLILSALLRPRREGVEAKIAEFPDIKVSAVNSLGSSISTSNAKRYWAIQYAEPHHCGDPCSGGFSA